MQTAAKKMSQLGGKLDFSFSVSTKTEKLYRWSCAAAFSDAVYINLTVCNTYCIRLLWSSTCRQQQKKVCAKLDFSFSVSRLTLKLKSNFAHTFFCCCLHVLLQSSLIQYVLQTVRFMYTASENAAAQLHLYNFSVLVLTLKLKSNFPPSCDIFFAAVCMCYF